MYLKKESSHHNDFTLVRSKKTNTSKNLLNPLYNTIIALQEIKHPLTSNLNLVHKKTNNGAVFYILLPKPKNQLFQSNSQFIDCHLTVNQYYKKDKTHSNHGLTTIHYTERYKHRSAEERSVVHVYFTKNGSFQHIQAKRLRDHDNITSEEILSFNANEIIKLKENIEEPAQIIEKLLTENYQLYQDAVDAANQIDVRMKLPSHNLEQGLIKKYIETAHCFIDAVDKINLYSYATTKDLRGKWMTSRIEDLNKKLLDFQADERTQDETLSEENTEGNQPNHWENKKKINARPARKNNLDDASKQYKDIEQLDQSIADNLIKLSLEPRNVSLKIKHAQLLSELNLQLLLISEISCSLDSQQRKHLCKLSEIANQENNLLDLFFEYFWEGDLEAIQNLYPFIGHLIFAEHIRDLLIKLVTYNPEEEKEQTMKEVFNFLYEKSSIYQFLMHVASIMLSDSNKHVYSSLLTIAYISNRLFAYQILLEQGMHPNSIGMMCNGYQIPNITIMIQYQVKHQIQFIQLALEHGADYTAKSGPLNIDNRRMTQSNKNYFNKNVGGEVAQAFDYVSKTSFIKDCCVKQKYKILELFIPQMSFEDTLEALSRLTNQSTISKRHFLPSKAPGFVLLTEFQTLEEIQQVFFDHTGQHRWYTIFIHSKEDADCVVLIHQLINALTDKIELLSKDSPTALGALQQKALEDTRFISRKNDLTYKFERCFFLLMLNPEPTFMTYQSLMQLHCRMAASANNELLYSEAKIYYNLAKQLAEFSCFSEKLMKTPIYEFVLKKLDAFNSSYDQQSSLQPRNKR